MEHPRAIIDLANEKMKGFEFKPTDNEAQFPFWVVFSSIQNSAFTEPFHIEEIERYRQAILKTLNNINTYTKRDLNDVKAVLERLFIEGEIILPNELFIRLKQAEMAIEDSILLYIELCRRIYSAKILQTV